MATNPLEILTLEQAREQLNVDADRTDQDEAVTQAIKGAVSHVMRKTGLPLLDRTLVGYVTPADDDCPVFLPALHVHEITAFAYWETSQKLRDEPSGTIEPEDLGRRVETPAGVLEEGTWIYPPAAGWPSYLRMSTFKVTALLRYELDAAAEDVRNQVILMTRHYYEQPEKFESAFAVNALAASRGFWT